MLLVADWELESKTVNRILAKNQLDKLVPLGGLILPLIEYFSIKGVIDYCFVCKLPIKLVKLSKIFLLFAGILIQISILLVNSGSGCIWIYKSILIFAVLQVFLEVRVECALYLLKINAVIILVFVWVWNGALGHDWLYGFDQFCVPVVGAKGQD